jgi:hypothetical protein
MDSTPNGTQHKMDLTPNGTQPRRGPDAKKSRKQNRIEREEQLQLGFLIFAIFLITRNTKRYERLACFAKILLVSQNKNMRNFVSFRFALQKLKRNFASFRKNLVLFRENFVLFRIEREIFCHNSRKSRGGHSANEFR